MAIILFGCLVIMQMAGPASPSFAKRFWIGIAGLFVLFGLSSFFPNSINAALLLARKQHGFYEVNGDQPIASIPLTGNIVSYLQNLPNAVMNVFFFPLDQSLLVDRIGWIGLVTFLFFIVLTFCVIKFPLRKSQWRNPHFVMLFAFCVLSYLLIGESVAYYGALLRYRCIAEVIFCILLLQLIDFQKINRLYIDKKNI